MDVAALTGTQNRKSCWELSRKTLRTICQYLIFKFSVPGSGIIIIFLYLKNWCGCVILSFEWLKIVLVKRNERQQRYNFVELMLWRLKKQKNKDTLAKLFLNWSVDNVEDFGCLSGSRLPGLAATTSLSHSVSQSSSSLWFNWAHVWLSLSLSDTVTQP